MRELRVLCQYFLAMGILIINIAFAYGQVTLDSLPPNGMNHRFYRDVFHMKRPGLSINGFDNGGDNSHGYGLKQIIENLYDNSAPDHANEQATFQDIYGSSQNLPSDPNYGTSNYSIGQVRTNSMILENKALVALVLYILHKNSVSDPIPDIGLDPSAYAVYINKLHNDLLKPASWYAVYGNGDGEGDDDDPVKWTRSVDNYARAIDLYLALENAFEYFGESDYTNTGTSRLLSQSQKHDLLNNFYLKVKDMHYYLYKLVEITPGIPNPAGVRMYEAEAGNRPMKIFVSMGYGALTLQATDYYSEYPIIPSDNTLANNSTIYKDAYTGNDSSTVTTSSYLNEALRSAGQQTSDNSIRYWNYQTDNGEQFWAEGPYYFEYSLLDIIPFWYAIRANNLLNYQNMNISDPFTNQWFIGPLNWLASLVTPDGKVPPLDDGNKQFIRYSDLLRWTPEFGSSSLDQKYQWIYNTVEQNHGNTDKSAEIVALATPRLTGSGSAPPEYVGDHYTVSGQSLPSQQVLVRKTTNGQTHYLLLNGEQGDAITRGEGHEQPDQLQLLYYVDGHSYLMDAGYNAPSAAHNSTWNGYNNHNVMTLDYDKNIDHGGLNSPERDLNKGRKISNHRQVTDLKLDKLHGGNIYHLSGSVLIHTLHTEYRAAFYHRDVLFINDAKPYVIDLNSLANSNNDLSSFYMQYHGNGTSVQSVRGWMAWDSPKRDNSGNRLFIYPGAVEFDMQGAPDPYGDLYPGYSGEETNDIKDTDLIEAKLTSYGDNHDFNTVAFLLVDTQEPEYFPHSINSYNSNTQNPFQAWYLQRDANTIDVLAMGSDIDDSGFPFPLNIDFDVIKDGTHLAVLTLTANKSFGFTRLVKTNGLWFSDTNYEVNMSQRTGHSYTSNTIISNQTFADGDPLYIGDNVTVMLEGNVNISNTTVYLGKDAYLKVSGSLTADDVVFTSNNPNDASKRYAWVELDGSSEIENCTFTGGQIGLVQQAGTNNYVRNSTFIKNNVGIRTSGGIIKLEACHINNNTSDGLQVWGAEVSTDQIFTAGQTLSWKRTHITQNDGHGIDVNGAGTLDLRYTEVSGNGTDEIVVRNGGWLYAGVTQLYIYDGYNRLTDNTNTGYYLKNLAYTTDGETYITNTAWAQMNYWGGGAPPAGKIYGAVQWDPYITQDSTIDHSTSAYSMNNQNIEAAINLYEAAPTNVLTMATTDQIVSDTTNGFTADELLWAKQRMMDLKEAIAKAPNDRWNIRRVQEWYHLARRYDVKNKWGERTGVNQKLEDWQEQMETWAPLSLAQSGALQTNNLTGGSASIDNKLNANIQQAKTVQLMGEASLLLSVDELLSDGKVKEALDRSNRVISKLENNDSKSILYAYQLKGWQQLGRYDSAYAALERIKAISPDAGMTSKVTDADFVSQEKWLLYLMKEHDQGVPSASAPTIAEKSVQSTDGNLPKVFALDANYPNPFNPTTTIPISLPKAAHVKVQVYNVAGQLVATLTNKDYQAGRYQLRFDAHTLASGMYLVRAHLGGKVFTRKLTLIK